MKRLAIALALLTASGTAMADETPRLLPCSAIAFDAYQYAIRRDRGVPIAHVSRVIMEQIPAGPGRRFALEVLEEVYARPEDPPEVMALATRRECGARALRQAGVGR